jgi:hypothetical protein
MTNIGMKTKEATTIECVGPLCIWYPVKRSKTMSISGKIERTNNNAMLGFTRRALPDPLPKRYASDICPTANNEVFLL